MSRALPAPWLNSDIKQSMLRRDYLHRKAIRSNNESEWKEYKVARNHVTDIIRTAKRDYYNMLITRGSNDSRRLWQTLRGVIPSKNQSNPSSIVIDDTVLNSDVDIANGFNRHFTSVASKLIGDDGNCNDNVLLNVINDSGNDNIPCLEMPSISFNFVDKEIRTMCANKATGLDEISCKILKLARPIIVESLTYILNLSLSTGIFPKVWKQAKVTPLHKSGALNDTNNYRPISILSVVSKILERAVHNHLYSYVSQNSVLNVHQSGFRPGHSTETSLVDMVDDWLDNINSGKMTGVAFIDLRKAFDTVNHSMLIKKIRDIGASDVTVNWFESYLSERTQKVCFKGTISESLPLSTGVPQGSILGPLLFLIFINDMANVVTHGKITMYADDTTLYTSGNDVNLISKQLTEDLVAIKRWLRANKLFLNTDKTNVMLIGTGSKLRNVDNDSFQWLLMIMHLKGCTVQNV